MTLPNGSPSHDTIQRCFHILKPNELQVIMNTIVIDLIDNFYAKMNPNSFISDKNKVKDIIAVDGKAMLGSYRASSKKGEIKKLQMLNVYSAKYSLCQLMKKQMKYLYHKK